MQVSVRIFVMATLTVAGGTVGQSVRGEDSVYRWGRWEQMLAPAAGRPVPNEPVAASGGTDRDLRPEESQTFSRQSLNVVDDPGGLVPGPVPIGPGDPVVVIPPDIPPPPPPPGGGPGTVPIGPGDPVDVTPPVIPPAPSPPVAGPGVVPIGPGTPLDTTPPSIPTAPSPPGASPGVVPGPGGGTPAPVIPTPPPPPGAG
jgi:hypothetical protein